LPRRNGLAQTRAQNHRPTSEKRTVVRKPNSDLRTREHLTDAEVERLMVAARSNRWGHRDATMILVAYRHGLRVSELVDLRWDQVDFEGTVLHVRRVKRGTPATHPLTGSELRALRRLRRESDRSPFVFLSERGHPFTAAGFARILERAARSAGLEDLKVHPHMLRHACGYVLANRGVDTRALQGYLGHRNIQHTVRYTELAPGRFKDFWRD
jgi:site-specific recombinase XerD